MKGKRRLKKTTAVIPYKRTASRVRQEAFIAEFLRQLGNKAAAARKLKIPYDTVMNWMRKPKFVERLKMAEDQLYEELQASAYLRAGTSSDVLAIFMLKKMKPELYDDKCRQMKFAKENELIDPERTATIRVSLVSEELPADMKPPSEDDGTLKV